jgi:hypothetical protein
MPYNFDMHAMIASSSRGKPQLPHEILGEDSLAYNYYNLPLPISLNSSLCDVGVTGTVLEIRQQNRRQ